MLQVLETIDWYVEETIYDIAVWGVVISLGAFVLLAIKAWRS